MSWAVLLAVGLAGCDAIPRQVTRAGSALELAPATTSRMVERDVPAPQVFQVTDQGLWDGRPSLGGVWVAHPDVRDPERVLIRNTQTGAEVVGALFRRERENPGPRFQISSEAAAALRILAGQPATLEVVALRLERVEAAPPPAPAAPPAAATAEPAPTSAPTAATAVAPEPGRAAAQEPRRGLRDLFRRREAADEPVAEVPVAPVPVPAGQPYDTVAITPLDAEPEAPRRGLRDLFRRREAGPEAPAGIAATALAPVGPVGPVAPAAAPVAATPLAATGLLSGDPGPAAPRPLAEPGLIAPGDATAAEAPRRGLRDLFRRRGAEAAAEPVPIPLPAAAPAATVQPAAVPSAATAPVRTSAPAPAGGRAFVQVGIFAVEGNAQRTLAQMRAAGLPAEIRPGRTGERPFWRVVLGPAGDAAGQAELIRRARAMGFADAYAVPG